MDLIKITPSSIIAAFQVAGWVPCTLDDLLWQCYPCHFGISGRSWSLCCPSSHSPQLESCIQDHKDGCLSNRHHGLPKQECPSKAKYVGKFPWRVASLDPGETHWSAHAGLFCFQYFFDLILTPKGNETNKQNKTTPHQNLGFYSGTTSPVGKEII